MSLRSRVHEIVFEADTPAGKAFDVALLAAIVLSVVAVMLESVASIRAAHGRLLLGIEWTLTIAFTIEYAVRLWSVRRPLRYARSFFGVVDLLSILPTWLTLLGLGTQSLLVIRALRLLRIFRVLKLVPYVHEARDLRRALTAGRRKISVFLLSIVMLMVILGSVMYLVEGPEHGFTSIPRSVYWAIVTMTTVGYGDIAPQTVPGQMIAAAVMIVGYAIIAVPTGIVTAEIVRSRTDGASTQACPGCGAEGHDDDAAFCRRCGAALHGGPETAPIGDERG